MEDKLALIFRSKNTVNILIKNMLDALIGGLTYWMIGWGAAYGEDGNGFIGGSNYFSYAMDPVKYPSWFFQFVFAATAATIVSGAIAERCQFFAYFMYSIFITGIFSVLQILFYQFCVLKPSTEFIFFFILKSMYTYLFRLGLSSCYPLGMVW